MMFTQASASKSLCGATRKQGRLSRKDALVAE